MNDYLLIYISVFLTITCNQPDSKGSGEIYLLKPALVEKSLVLSSYIYDLEFIPLEEHSENLLRYAPKILIKDSLIIVRDKVSRSKYVYFFNQSGKFLYKDNHVPDDFPGESYADFDFMDFTLNPDKGVLYMTDVSRHCIIEYDLKNKNKSVVMRGIDAFNLFYHKNTIYAYTPRSENGLLTIIDANDFNIKGEYVYEKDLERGRGAIISNPIALWRDTVFFGIFFSDTIYYHGEKGIQPYAVLGNSPATSVRYISMEQFQEVYFGQNKADRFPNMAIPWGELSFWEDVWFLHMVNHKYLLWDRKSGLSVLLPFYGIKNTRNLLSEAGGLTKIFKTGEYYYSYINLTEEFYSQAKELLESDNDHSMKPALMSLLDEYPPERNFQNPVITRFKIRDDFMDAFR